jgi:hypothetical protein
VTQSSVSWSQGVHSINDDAMDGHTRNQSAITNRGKKLFTLYGVGINSIAHPAFTSVTDIFNSAGKATGS